VVPSSLLGKAPLPDELRSALGFTKEETEEKDFAVSEAEEEYMTAAPVNWGRAASRIQVTGTPSPRHGRHPQR
jgi:hypothetical protein